MSQAVSAYPAVSRLFSVVVTLQRRPWVFLMLVVPLTLSILFTGHIGQGMPVLPTYLETPACPQPCWHDLRPGISTLQEVFETVDSSLLTAPDSLEPLVGRDFSNPSVRWETRFFPSYDVQARFRGDLLTRLDLYVDGLLLLGDVFAVFGEPSHAVLCPRVATGFNYRRAVSATLYFLQGSVEVWAFTPDSDDWQIKHDMRIARITYHTLPPDAETWVPLTVARWHGFGRTGYSGPCN